MEQHFNNEGVLCPNCEYGIITKYHVSTIIYEYDFKESRIAVVLRMKCPYCGDTISTDDTDGGYRLTYNWIDPAYPELDYHVLKTGRVIRIDLH